MPRPRRNRVSQLRRDLSSIGADLDAIYGPPGSVEHDTSSTDPLGLDTVSVHDARGSREVPRAEWDARHQPKPQSVELQAHLLGPEHLGRFIEVRVPAENIRPGTRRPEGPLAGRLVGYRAAAQPVGPNTGTPIKAFDLLIQQGPSTTTAVVSWADPIRIA